MPHPQPFSAVLAAFQGPSTSAPDNVALPEVPTGLSTGDLLVRTFVLRSATVPVWAR